MFNAKVELSDQTLLFIYDDLSGFGHLLSPQTGGLIWLIEEKQITLEKHAVFTIQLLNKIVSKTLCEA